MKVWCDKNYKTYTLKEIDDRYLLNILKFISNGGGYTEFMSEKTITLLFNEAKKRGIKHNYELEQLISAYYQKLSDEEYWWEFMD